MGGPLHLTRRFLGSLSPRPLSAADGAWVRDQLGAGELALWRRMPRADQKHAAGVARDVVARLGPQATRPVVAAALLHDVGKVEAGLGTVGRVAATVAALAFGRDRASAWSGGIGIGGRVGRYLQHDRIGAELLEAAGSDRLTVAWARCHHRPATEWEVPGPVGAVLHEADDD